MVAAVAAVVAIEDTGAGLGLCADGDTPQSGLPQSYQAGIPRHMPGLVPQRFTWGP